MQDGQLISMQEKELRKGVHISLDQGRMYEEKDEAWWERAVRSHRQV
jgi:hypothetical protein